MLSAFRPGYGCQSVLLNIFEDWKLALDCKKYTAAIFMDLSKAFDYIPHDLIWAKLNAYGFSTDATRLVKLGNVYKCSDFFLFFIFF